MKEQLKKLLSQKKTVRLGDVQRELDVPSLGIALEYVTKAGGNLVYDQVTLDNKNLDGSFADLQSKMRRLEANLKKEKAANKELVQTLDDKNAQLEVMGALSDSQSPTLTLPATPKPSRSKRSRTAVVVASDWHVGERVDPETVNGLNEYNPEIAAERSRIFWDNAITLVNSDPYIDRVVVALLGDFISGVIHPELLESNFLSPMEEVLLAQDLLLEGLERLANEVDLMPEHITVVTSSGNHGRATEKTHLSTHSVNSYEWLMYKNMARKMPSLNWVVELGYFTYLPVQQMTFRFSHYDRVKYRGGVQGISAPMGKYISRVNQTKWADYDIGGHYHTVEFQKNFAVNGSLIGPSSFSISSGFPANTPEQIMLVVDKNLGIINRITVPVTKLL